MVKPTKQKSFMLKLPAMNKLYSWLFWPRSNTRKIVSFYGFITILNGLMPIFGVLFFNWETFPILMFYCIEVIIGITVFLFDAITTIPRKGVNDFFPVWVSGTFLVGVVIIGFYVPIMTMIIIAVEKIANALSSIRSIYFVISAVILFFDMIIASRINNKSVIKGHNKNSGTRAGWYLINAYVLLICTGFIVYFSLYWASLIIIAVVKIFVELRSFLKHPSEKNMVIVN